METKNIIESRFDFKTAALAILYLGTASLFSIVMVWGGALFLPLALIIIAPMILLTKPYEKSDFALSTQEMLTRWKKMPQSIRLERELEKNGIPVLISHRESTAIVYANQTAKSWLGDNLIGRTMDSEADLKFKPLKVNGEKVNRHNHPAALVQQGEQNHLDVVWGTPRGEIDFAFEGRGLPMGSRHIGEYFLLTLHPKTPMDMSA